MTLDNARSSSGLLFVAMLLILGADFLPASRLTPVMKCAGLGCLVFRIAANARDGLVRRRASWTRGSWLRFATASLFPVCSLLIAFALAELLDARLPFTGAGGSMRRGIWVLAMLLFTLYGGIGLLKSINWLSWGDASQQFEWSPKRFWRRAPARR